MTKKMFDVEGGGPITKEQIAEQKMQKKLNAINYSRNYINEYSINTYHNWDACSLQVPDCSIDMIITSPPYNAGIKYNLHDDNMQRDDYTFFLCNFLKESYRVLVDDGRIAINITNVGRKPRYYNSGVVVQLAEKIGFVFRGEIIWSKIGTGAISTAWGSWQSSSNPILRDKHEYILIFHKKHASKVHITTKSDITRDEFLEYTKSIWEISPKARSKDSHPAPFPEEIPYRLMKLYTNPGDIVLDPFVGSGTTCEVAKEIGRRWIGSDIDISYVYQKALKENKKANYKIAKQLSTKTQPRDSGLTPYKLRRQALRNLHNVKTNKINKEN